MDFDEAYGVVPESYRKVKNGGIWLKAEADDMSKTRNFAVCIIRKRDGSPEFLIVSREDPHVFEAWLREIDPVAMTAFKLRLEAWAQSAVQKFLNAFLDEMR
jgi:hypothetical protein